MIELAEKGHLNAGERGGIHECEYKTISVIAGLYKCGCDMMDVTRARVVSKWVTYHEVC